MWTLSGFADEIDPDLTVQCGVLARLGIRHLEFRSAWGTNVLDLSDGELARVAEILAAHHIGVTSIGSPIGKVAVTDDFDTHLARFHRALAVADRLGAPVIRLFSFFIPDGDDPDDHRDEVLRRLSAIAAAAKGRGVVLALENEKKVYGDIPRRLLDVFESVGAEHLRLAWDPANFVQNGVRPYDDAFPVLRQHLEYVQVKDAIAATGEVVPAGEGDGQLRQTFAALRDGGYDGVVSLEPHLGGTGPDLMRSGPAAYTRAATALTGLLDELRIGCT
jgi:sugar phosphate isomerase/epimerase